MFKLVIILLFPLILFSQMLESSYSSSSGIFYSNDIYPNIDLKFEVIKVPNDKSHIRESSKTITKIFELYGYTITPSSSYVDFYKESNDYNKLKLEIKRLLSSRYPSIEIESISIVPRGKEIVIDEYSQSRFSDTIYTNPRGTFYITDKNGVRRYLDYHIKATINTLQTTKKITRNEPLSISNTTTKRVTFSNSKDHYLDSFPSDSMRFKASLKPHSQIYLKNLSPAPLISKNATITAIIKDDGIIAEFPATAIQEGLLYDIITIEKSDKKRLKAKVIGENMVELE